MPSVFQKQIASMSRPRTLQKSENLSQNHTPQSSQSQMVLWGTLSMLVGKEIPLLCKVFQSTEIKWKQPNHLMKLA